MLGISDILEENISPFASFSPLPFHSSKHSKYESNHYFIPRNHGIKGKIVLHNLSDNINEGRHFLKKVLIEYKIENQRYVIFSVKDFFEAPYAFSNEGKGNILGDIAERISRRITKYFLHHLSPDGATGGIFDKRFNPKQKNGYIITNNDQYILQILKYPNIILLKKNAINEPWEYKNIKELDGFFDYRYKGKRHILVLETKLEKLQLNVEKLVTDLFNPLRSLFPSVSFHYILFSSNHSLFEKYHRYLLLRQRPMEIYEKLKEHSIGTLFFGFCEEHHEFNTIAEHLISIYRRIAHQKVEINGKIIIDKNTLALYDKGENPFMVLVKDRTSHLWQEI